MADEFGREAATEQRDEFLESAPRRPFVADEGFPSWRYGPRPARNGWDTWLLQQAKPRHSFL